MRINIPPPVPTFRELGRGSTALASARVGRPEHPIADRESDVEIPPSHQLQIMMRLVVPPQHAKHSQSTHRRVLRKVIGKMEPLIGQVVANSDADEQPSGIWGNEEKERQAD